MKENRKEALFIQLTSGRGPAECCWVVAQTLKVLMKHCEQMMLSANIVERVEGPENGTLSSALIQVQGTDIKNVLKEWQGTIQWIGKSKFRKFHKRRNWFIGISFSDLPKEQKLDKSALIFQSFRGSGPGGQHRNKVETAIRVTHKTTGVTAVSSEFKSQQQNKKAALIKLEEAFRNQLLSDQRKLIEEQWSEHTSLERGNAVKVFEGHKFQMIR